MAEPIGLIAGAGRLPVMEAQGIRAAGRPVVCVGLAGCYDADLPGQCDAFAEAGVIRLGRWIRLLRRWGATEAVMVGRVRKSRMYDPLRLLRHFPDWRAARLWYRVLRHDKRTPAMLTALAEELGRNGIALIDTTRYIPEYLADAGVMTRRQPTAAQLGDARFGLSILQAMLDLGVGQSIAVKEREVIAVEAMEGTDAMILRTGELCRSGGWTMIKAAGAKKDLRFDVPTVGPDTITNLAQAGAHCLALEAGRVILAEKPALLTMADEAGITVIGL